MSAVLVGALTESLTDIRRNLVGALGHLLAQGALPLPCRTLEDRSYCVGRSLCALINLQFSREEMIMRAHEAKGMPGTND